MNNEKKLTAQDLALYYRGQAKLISRAEKLDSFHGFAHVGQIVVIDSILLASVEQGLYEVKPILRPLSDMTEDEARSVWGKCYGDDFGDGECLLHLIATVDSDERNDSEFDVLLGYPDGWRYLRSRHFDLFGWIEAGLAIDKTKLESK